MTPALQTFLALGIVAIAASWLVWRGLTKRKNPGCGHDCGCPTQAIKAKLKR